MIGIVDYGSGNIQAILNIYKRLKVEATVITTPDCLNRAERIVLPGVGAFDEAMSKLNDSGLRGALDNAVLNNKVPVMGICVGMQVMACSSEEGKLDGLGWIPGKVKRFDENKIKTVPKVPHMGWNQIESKEHDMFNDIDNEFGFYFLHSYYYEAENPDNVIAQSIYNQKFDSAINREHIFGFQFHPEKSHHNGIQLFNNFAKLSIC